MVHSAGALRYLMPMDGEHCFFFWRFYRHFSTFKKPWLPIQRGGFHFKSPKSDSNFFLRGSVGLRVSSHLCLLGAILRVPWTNVANLTKSVYGCSPPWHHQQIERKHWWRTFPKCEAKVPYHLLIGPLFSVCLHLNPLRYTKGRPISGWKNMLV
jgi:hypothetical protein